MKALMLGKLVMVAIAAVVLVAQALAQQATTEANEAKRLIVVSLEDRKLALVEDGQVKKIYTVAVGKPSTPSPEGTFTIERRVANPTYHHDGKTVLPGPHNPVGTRWMGLSIRGYGIHGTNEPTPSARPPRTDAFAWPRPTWKSSTSWSRWATRWSWSASATKRRRSCSAQRQHLRRRRSPCLLASSEPPAAPAAPDGAVGEHNNRSGGDAHSYLRCGFAVRGSAMHLLTEAMSGLGAVLLPVAAGLLLEELTFGGLVRLLLAPWPGTRRRGTSGGRDRSPECEHGERNKGRGEGKCSH